MASPLLPNLAGEQFSLLKTKRDNLYETMSLTEGK